MKRIFVLVIVSVLAGAVSLYAQHSFRVTVPFEFTTVSGTLPSGEYFIRMDRGLILINGLQGQGSTWVLGTTTSRTTIAEVITKWQPGVTGGAADIHNQKDSGTRSQGGGSGENCVVFTKYGDKYFLHEIWKGYTGREVSVSKAEQAIQRAGNIKPQELELAALAR